MAIILSGMLAVYAICIVVSISLIYILTIILGMNIVNKAYKLGIITKKKCITLSVLQIMSVFGLFSIIHIYKQIKQIESQTRV